MNDRTCIVTRKTGDVDQMFRFVAAPDGSITPDLKRNLPGRGCWVTATREHVDRAAKKELFGRALKQKVTVDPDLGEKLDALLVRNTLGALGLAKKAGGVLMGAPQVAGKVRSGGVLVVLHAKEAAEDGVRKIQAARHAVASSGGPDIPALTLFTKSEMGLAFGGENVIHAAVLEGNPGGAAFRRLKVLDWYRDGFPDESEPDAAGAAEDGI